MYIVFISHRLAVLFAFETEDGCRSSETCFSNLKSCVFIWRLFLACCFFVNLLFIDYSLISYIACYKTKKLCINFHYCCTNILRCHSYFIKSVTVYNIWEERRSYNNKILQYVENDLQGFAIFKCHLKEILS